MNSPACLRTFHKKPKIIPIFNVRINERIKQREGEGRKEAKRRKQGVGREEGREEEFKNEKKKYCMDERKIVKIGQNEEYERDRVRKGRR